MSGYELRSRREATALGAKPRALIDAIADQVRIYPLDERTARGVVVLGARVTGERQDFWVVW
jgi:CRISPR/Cas system-associated endoribonuclease Cas2